MAAANPTVRSQVGVRGNADAALPRWRELAKAMLPVEFAEASYNSTQHCSIYDFFFALLPKTRLAHRDNDVDKLGRMHGFAQWAAVHPNKQIWNAAGVAFYEHLFDDDIDADAVMAWISPQVRQTVLGLWQYMLPAERFASVARSAERIPFSHQKECETAIALVAEQGPDR
ncbi:MULTISPECIES: hypothetical protein [unclassified Mesorhizobium]|uniref:DUF7674 family protein n=1 Tax=unclassified Mesorhizobium TaxID=325217 RepID=UPI00333E0158